jgi:hypothetical protein
MSLLHGHSVTKPPGILLSYTATFALSPPSPDTADRIAIALGLLAALGVPMTYAAARALGARRDAAFVAASLFAVAPSLGAFWPSFDAVYPAVACALVITWHRALLTGRVVWSVAFGLVLAIAALYAYNFLVLGAFLLLHALVVVWLRHGGPGYVRALVAGPGRQALVVVATWALAYAVVHASSGFDPVGTFRRALAIQGELEGGLDRPWRRIILFDLTDYALGMAWLPAIPAVLGAAAAWHRAPRAHFPLVATCLAQPLIVAVTGILPTETARTWIFMFPFVLIPAGIEMATWRPGSRAIVYTLVLAIHVVIARSLIFVLI